jgi:hypothetical protein
MSGTKKNDSDRCDPRRADVGQFPTAKLHPATDRGFGS